ncbi:hypothetical protein [Desulforhopalus singaporensis]|uniref:Lipoprotein n=1 Tax=Desulforhopalus singaporensis TaxID=91360 RepID=A0A1H0VUZ1_9BACT|nr:hypothetical protein [Desulforhopalus singaporensis]SDP81906.1 hypothetical protein SAMN05660330_04236 [Desulforhopalus singaporensis]
MKYNKITKKISVLFLFILVTSGCAPLSPTEKAEIEYINQLMFRAINCINYEVIELDDGASDPANLTESVLNKCQQQCLSYGKADAINKNNVFTTKNSVEKCRKYALSRISYERESIEKEGIVSQYHIGDWLYLEADQKDNKVYQLCTNSTNSYNKLTIFCNVPDPSSGYAYIPFIYISFDKEIGWNYIDKDKDSSLYNVFAKVIYDGQFPMLDHRSLWKFKEGTSEIAKAGKAVHYFIDKLKKAERIDVYLNDDYAPIKFNIKGISEGVKKLEESCSTFYLTGEEQT